MSYLMPDDLLCVGPFLEWTFAGQEIVHCPAETVDVGSYIDPAIDDLLRGNVVAGADDVADLVFLDERGRVLVEETGQAHVEDLHDALPIEKEIARLDVAMHQAAFVGVLQAERRLSDVVGGALGLE